MIDIDLALKAISSYRNHEISEDSVIYYTDMSTASMPWSEDYNYFHENLVAKKHEIAENPSKNYNRSYVLSYLDDLESILLDWQPAINININGSEFKISLFGNFVAKNLNSDYVAKQDHELLIIQPNNFGVTNTKILGFFDKSADKIQWAEKNLLIIAEVENTESNSFLLEGEGEEHKLPYKKNFTVFYDAEEKYTEFDFLIQ